MRMRLVLVVRDRDHPGPVQPAQQFLVPQRTRRAFVHEGPVQARHAPEEDDFPDGRGEVLIEADGVLRDVSDSVPAAESRDRLAEQLDLPAGGPLESEHESQERGLAASVRADDAEDLSFLDDEIDVPQDLLTVPVQVDIADCHDGTVVRDDGDLGTRRGAHVHSSAVRRFARFISMSVMYVSPFCDSVAFRPSMGLSTIVWTCASWARA